MAELVIPIRDFIGDSDFNWDTWEFEWATNCDDLRMAVQYGLPNGEPVTSIVLEIGKCYGGSTIHGLEMYNYLQSLGLPIRTRILSLAASMGSVLPLVGEEVEIDATAQVLVHGPSGYADGTIAQVGSTLKQLTDTAAALRDIYMARTGQPAAVVEEWMSKDTWFNAQEALAAGLVTKIVSVAPKAAAVVADAQASARRAKYAGIVARAASRPTRATAPRPRTTSKTAARPAASSPRPMATTPKKAAPKAGAPNRSSLSAAQKTAAQAIAALAKSAGIKATVEGFTEAASPTAEAVGTVLADGAGTLYTDGELAQGSEVFNDEALSVATADAEYEAEDGRVITVAGGKVESITDAEASAEGEATTTEALTAALAAALAPFTARLDKIEETFAKAVPPTPRARAAAGQAADPKASTPQPRKLLAGATGGQKG